MHASNYHRVPPGAGRLTAGREGERRIGERRRSARWTDDREVVL